MDITTVLEEAREVIGSKGVFGAPYEKNGITVIPAARVMGGAGGGTGQAPVPEGEGAETARPTGSGAGFGVSARPIGAFVVKGDQVTWVPSIDVNRLMLGFQVALVVFFLVIRSVAKSRAAAFK